MKNWPFFIVNLFSSSCVNKTGSFRPWLLITALLSPMIFSGCSSEAKPPRNSMEGLAAASDICVNPDAVETDHNENPLFQPESKDPIKPLEPLLGNVRARSTVSLNGQWNTIVDQLGIGDASPLLRGGIGKNASYEPTELLEYSFSGGQKLQVPGDWNSQRESLFWYRGIVWYQKEFNYQPPEGKRVFLYFGGANFAKDVYVNGQLLARHKGGFTPFNTEVTDYLQAGKNAVVVKVNSMSGPAEIPTEYNDWMNFGGLTRDVMLVETPKTFVRNYKLQLKKGSDRIIKGWVQLDGRSSGRNIKLDIDEAGIHQTFKTDENGRAEFEFEADLKLWSV